jgi:nucleoside-diphosphate-sugar epimerase
MLAAAAGAPFTIPFRGGLQMQYAEDLAKIILRCARAEPAGAPVVDIGGPSASIEEIIAAIKGVEEDAAIDSAGGELPFPADTSNDALQGLIGEVEHTPLKAGTAASIAAFKSLLKRGLLQPEA